MKGCGSLISGILGIIGIVILLNNFGFFEPSKKDKEKAIGLRASKLVQEEFTRQERSKLEDTLPKTTIEDETLKSPPNFKIAANHGLHINLLVPSNTTDEQLKTLIYSFRQARLNKSFSRLIPPTQKKWYNGDYSRFFIQVFDDPNWASVAKLKIVLGETSIKDINKFNTEYNRHIRAEYVYETARDNKWCESGSIGFSEMSFRSKNYQELFSKKMFP